MLFTPRPLDVLLKVRDFAACAGSKSLEIRFRNVVGNKLCGTVCQSDVDSSGMVAAEVLKSISRIVGTVVRCAYNASKGLINSCNDTDPRDAAEVVASFAEHDRVA